MEYAVNKSVSLSTLRRHIKSGKIQFKVESGRYLVLDADAAPESPVTRGQTDLNRALQMAQEEIAELKTLIALYEERMPHARQ